MLDYKTDRLNYGELLAPPAGFMLSKAVATTYSLELETLTAAAITLGLNEASDSELLTSRIAAFDAIDQVSQKMIVFCEAGQIRMPNKPSPLHMLFEKCLIPVALPGKRKSRIYPSFHPKMWLLEYEGHTKRGTEHRYRLIVMSRNLTGDRSWDVSVMLEGEETKSRNRRSQPLCSFLDFLYQFVNRADPDRQQKRTLLSEMKERIEKVSFQASANGKPFYDFDIMPLGIDKNNDAVWENDPLMNGSTCHDLVVMSPFVTPGTMALLNSKLGQLKDGNRGVLITQRPELWAIRNAVSHFDVYVMKDAVIDGEDNLPENESNSHGRQQDIHAKMFLYRKYSDAYLYMGSMNASERGTGIYPDDDAEERAVNVELMVRLRAYNYYLNATKFYQDVIGDDEVKSPFEKVSLDDERIQKPTVDPKNMLLQSLKKVCRYNMKARVELGETDYRIVLDCRMKEEQEGISIAPLYAPGLEQKLQAEMRFEGLVVRQLSELYSVKATDGTNQVEKIMLIPTQGIPEERDKSIIRYAINDKKAFSDYVAFVLGDDSMQTLTEIIEDANKLGSDDGHRTSVMTSLYERMLKAACKDPMRLKDIGRIVEKIDDETIVPKEITVMYQTFMEALRLCQRKSKQY